MEVTDECRLAPRVKGITLSKSLSIYTYDSLLPALFDGRSVVIFSKTSFCFYNIPCPQSRVKVESCWLKEISIPTVPRQSW